MTVPLRKYPYAATQKGAELSPKGVEERVGNQLLPPLLHSRMWRFNLQNRKPERSRNSDFKNRQQGAIGRMIQ